MVYQLGGYSSKSHFIQYWNGTPQLNSRLGFINPGLTLHKQVVEVINILMLEGWKPQNFNSHKFHKFKLFKNRCLLAL